MMFGQAHLTFLGRGANSEIFRYGLPERAVVLKNVSVSCLRECRHLANQFKMLNRIEHPNIIRVLKYRENVAFEGTDTVDQQSGNEAVGNGGKKKSGKNVLVFEYAQYGSLLSFCAKKKLNAKEARWVMGEILEAMSFLHGNSIAHRDIKLQNVLVASDKGKVGIKLADFGFAESISDDPNSKAYKGTARGYMAPEIHNLLVNPNEYYDVFQADVFALGVVMFALVLGRLPFEYATPQNGHYRLIVEQKVDKFWQLHQKPLQKLQTEQSNLDQSFKALFIDMIHPDPKRRPTLHQIFERPWLQGRQQIIKEPTSN